MREQNTADITANGGGEGSATGNTLIYDLPTNPTNSELKGKVVKIIIANRSGADGDILLFDEDSTGTAAPAVCPMNVRIGVNETVFLNEEDIGEWYIKEGVMAQASNGATGTGYKVTAEVEVF
jgi:hypothetical protein